MEDGVVGIDLGGTCTKFGLVTREGGLLASRTIPTDSTMAYEIFFERLYEQIGELRTSLDVHIKLKGIGVGAPTGNHFLGTIDNASNLDWSGKVPVTEVLGSQADLPTVLTNDANAAAVGEMLYGAAKEMENFIAITLGTGLGCGIVANSELLIGHNSHAGEIGHTTVFYDGRPCKCGRRGCLETYVSAPGLICTVRDLIESSDIESNLREISLTELSAEKITEAAQNNDPLALEAFGYTGKILGLKLADIVACIDPEAIIISGGLAKAGPLILEPAKKNLEKQLLNVFKESVDIVPSSLTEKNAAILGAAAFAWKQLENSRTYKG